MTEQPDNFRHFSIDFAIVTALKVELDAVLVRITDVEKIQEAGDPYTYYRGRLEIPDGSAYQLVVMMLLEPGNLEAASATTLMIQRWKPQHIFLVGIAGGIKKAGIRQGDVVVARHVHYYEPSKITENGEERRPHQYFTDNLLWGRTRNYEAAEWKSDINVAPPTKPGFSPKAHFGPIASGESVIASNDALDRLKSECPKLLAVAMEGAGVALTAAKAKIPFLEVRGISDLADRKKDDRWHSYAANSAAAFISGFLKSRPVEPFDGPGRMAPSRPPLLILRAQSLRQIRPDEVLEALSGEYRQRDHKTVSLDFTDLSSQTRLEHPEQALERLIDPKGALMRSLLEREQSELAFHGLVAIPLAVALGYVITDRQPVQLFDFHPDRGSWIWPNDLDSAALNVSGLPHTRNLQIGEVLIRISITFPVTQEATDKAIQKYLHAIELSVPSPRRNLVRSEAQVLSYGQIFRETLDGIVRLLPNARRIHVFYSGPVSLAFHFGQQISENIHPPVTIWNYSRSYDWGVNLDAVSRGENGVIHNPVTSRANSAEKTEAPS